MYLAGLTAQDFNRGAQPLTPFDFDGVPAYGRITDKDRAHAHRSDRGQLERLHAVTTVR